MPLIDHYLPVHQFQERHSILTTASPKQLLDVAQRPEATEDPWAQRFIQLRELPDRLLGALGASSGLSQRPAFSIQDFMPLGRDADRELAFGLVGRFWQRDYGLIQLREPQRQFADFSEPQLTKLVLNFSTEPIPGGRTRLVTTTRVHCVDSTALRRFTPYWWLIRPVSGLIRRRLLNRIHHMAMTEAM